MGAVEVGAALAARLLRNKKEPEAPLASMVAALLGLLAFILAFTFGMTASRFDARKELVLDESNALGTTYLRAGLLPEAQGSEIRRLLREYADLRLCADSSNINEVVRNSEAIHGRLWAQTKELTRQDMDSEVRSLFIASLNELIDVHQRRKTVGLQYRIPGSVWLIVYVLAALSMLTLGYQIGMSGMRRLRGAPVLAAAFSLVIVMIADIDRPGEGFMRVNQQPIADVQQTMAGDSP
jgi:hypothetical protein